MNSVESHLPSESEELFFYNYGYNLYFFQLIEDFLNDIQVGLKFIEWVNSNYDFTDNDIFNEYSNNKSNTYGTNVKNFISKLDTLSELGIETSEVFIKKLEGSVEIRNYLSHHIALVSFGSMFSDELRKPFVDNQIDIRTICIFLYREISRISNDLAIKAGLGAKPTGDDAIKLVQSKQKYVDNIINRAMEIRRPKKK